MAHKQLRAHPTCKADRILAGIKFSCSLLWFNVKTQDKAAF